MPNPRQLPDPIREKTQFQAPGPPRPQDRSWKTSRPQLQIQNRTLALALTLGPLLLPLLLATMRGCKHFGRPPFAKRTGEVGRCWARPAATWTSQESNSSPSFVVDGVFGSAGPDPRSLQSSPFEKKSETESVEALGPSWSRKTMTKRTRDMRARSMKKSWWKSLSNSRTRWGWPHSCKSPVLQTPSPRRGQRVKKEKTNREQM
mmetsp:Transcript_3441/g.7697  ORF Transcript_3441/g.7697 Transcript_3441/m.7697 type:complete len:204 (+) Transcript_3441:1096-1707(+)